MYVTQKGKKKKNKKEIKTDNNTDLNKERLVDINRVETGN